LLRERERIDREALSLKSFCNNTTARGTAGIDLALVLAAELFGGAVAQEIQLWMEYNPEPPLTDNY